MTPTKKDIERARKLWDEYSDELVVDDLDSAMNSRPYETVVDEFVGQLAAAIAQARAEEREECAVLMDERAERARLSALECEKNRNDIGCRNDTLAAYLCREAAKAIRARNEESAHAQQPK